MKSTPHKKRKKKQGLSRRKVQPLVHVNHQNMSKYIQSFETYAGPGQTSKMESFTTITIVNAQIFKTEELCNNI